MDLTGMRVLVVDDDEECRDCVQMFLEDVGMIVTPCSSAEEGLYVLGESAHDAVVTDKNLPGMDGIEMIRHIRETHGDLPVVLVTGHATIKTAVEAVRLGAQDYVCKPLEDGDDIIQALWKAVDHHRLQEENRLLHEQLIQVKRLESLGMLSAGIAHEINNPTSFVMGNLEIMRFDVPLLLSATERLCAALAEMAENDPERRQSILDVVKSIETECALPRIAASINEMLADSIEGASRIRTIVNNLRGFARVGEPKVVSVNPNDEIERSLALVWNELKYKCRVIKELGDVPSVLCDAGQLDQVLVNLLINASQALEGGEGVITVRSFARNGMVHIEVSDNGKGISKEDMEHIFDPFFSTKDVGEGTGLGLSIAYGIIRNYDGEIKVESEVGEGTTFSIILKGGNVDEPEDESPVC